ncbi:DMT family transporter [Pseudomonas sp. NA-150]|uniref:DMT family transporter n=1 Tax=Pseudomonas sp. NA-150 TaxID=3367525 RepID=UPI0037CB173A
MNTSIRRGSLEMIAAMLISGTIGWFVLVSGQPVLDVVFWRCVFGAVTLLLISAVLGYLRPGILTRSTFTLAVLSGVAIVGNWLLLFASYSRASIAISTAVYNVQPFMLVGLAAVFLGEKITAQKLVWLGVSFVGMLAIVSAHGDQSQTGDTYLTGIALALGAALLYAFAALIIKRLSGTPPHLIALIQVCTGTLMLAPFADFSPLPQQATAWGSLLTLGLVHTGVMYVLLYGAIQKLPTALTGALSFIYPIAAIFVDWLAFGHRLSLLQWLGVIAILLAAAGMQQGWKWKGRTKIQPVNVPHHQTKFQK